MATYKIPYQDLSFAVPDENELFFTSGDRGQIHTRIGNKIYSVGIQNLGAQYLKSIGATTGLPPGAQQGEHGGRVPEAAGGDSLPCSRDRKAGRDRRGGPH